jgi:ceramide glucosyltransferase
MHVASVWAVIARFRNAATTAGSAIGTPGVTLIRPVCGLENFTRQTLETTFRLDYSRYEILFCVAHSDDPVTPLVRELISAHPHIDAELLIGNDLISANPKLNNMAKAWHAARHDWIVMADSNVLMQRDYIQRLLAAWRPDTGLVCSPPLGCQPGNLWAELECGFLNTYQARWQCFADELRHGFAQGKTMLWRRQILDSAGGLRALGSELAEDAAATKVVRKFGLRVRLLDRPVLQPLGRRGATDVWRRQLRWARLRRESFMTLFLSEILAGGIPPLLCWTALTLAWDWPIAPSLIGFAAAWYGAEALLAYAAGWHLSYRSAALWLLRDLMLPALWIASWTGNEFEWRGNAMRIAGKGGTA